MRARYYRVSRLVVLPDYQGIGVGKRLLNFIAELYVSQTKVPFYILTSNPQIIRGNMANWKITRYGHASKGQGNTRINSEIRSSLSRKRITVSLQYIPRLRIHTLQNLTYNLGKSNVPQLHQTTRNLKRQTSSRSMRDEN